MSRTRSIISRFPDFYPATERDSVFYKFIEIFGRTLDQVELDLLAVMRSHWVESADNEGSQGFDTAKKGDLDKIFSLYLENLGGTSQLKQQGRRSGPEGQEDDALYRERIRGLIEVLKSGASTREGIITIVAANLGIVGESPEAQAARQQIHIIEFLPELRPVDLGPVVLSQIYTIDNPNDSTINNVRLRLRKDFPAPLYEPQFVNVDTGMSVRYAGGVTGGDELAFFANGTAFLNGVVVPIQGTLPPLLQGKNRLRVEALVGVAEGRFDQALFDFAAFEAEQLQAIGSFDREGSNFDAAVFAYDTPAVDVELTFLKLTPGAFMVRIPWDIPGFTDKFDELSDPPRNQIKYIVDKVKAAGVFSVIAYEKRFEEAHDLSSALTVKRPFIEEHAAEEGDFSMGSVQVPYPGGLHHAMADSLITSGVFDYTSFDSLNRFA
jgi:hypothetical protein